MRISCKRLHDLYPGWPKEVQTMVWQFTTEDELPCPNIQHDRDGTTHAYFKFVPVSKCRKCPHSYWK